MRRVTKSKATSTSRLVLSGTDNRLRTAHFFLGHGLIQKQQRFRQAEIAMCLSVLLIPLISPLIWAVISLQNEACYLIEQWPKQNSEPYRTSKSLLTHPKSIYNNTCLSFPSGHICSQSICQISPCNLLYGFSLVCLSWKILVLT